MNRYSTSPFWLAALLVLLAGCGTGNFHVTLSDELEPLYPDSQVDSVISEITLDAARGTIASVHLLITGLEPGSDLSLSVKGKAAGPVTWYRLIDVPVTENTGLDSRTEKYSGQINPYVIRRAPFRIYEAMEPIGFPVDYKDRQNVLNNKRESCGRRNPLFPEMLHQDYIQDQI